MGKQNILITGISGQDGAFLANRFLSDNSTKYNIFGTSRQKPSIALKNINSLGSNVNNLKIFSNCDNIYFPPFFQKMQVR